MTPPRSPRNASYSIDVRLDPASRTITATEIITWRNITDEARRRPAVSPVLERVAGHALDLACASATLGGGDGDAARGRTTGRSIDVTAIR